MLDNNVHRLPVLDANEKLVGVISPLDMLAHVADLELDETVESYMQKAVVPSTGSCPRTSRSR